MARPTYNHTRGDSSETPCPLCAALVAARAAVVQPIIDAPVAPHVVRKLHNLAGEFPYTTSILIEIAQWLDSPEIDDHTGAELVAQFAGTFAEHEADTL